MLLSIQDTLKTKESCLKACSKALGEGKVNYYSSTLLHFALLLSDLCSLSLSNYDHINVLITARSNHSLNQLLPHTMIQSVVVDNTNPSASVRAEYISLARWANLLTHEILSLITVLFYSILFCSFCSILFCSYNDNAWMGTAEKEAFQCAAFILVLHWT